MAVSSNQASVEVAEAPAIYPDARARFVALAREVPEDVWDRQVPSTPLWKARDLVAHLVGVSEDFLAGNFPTTISPQEWTALQVARRHDKPIAQILADWDEVFPRIVEALDAGAITGLALVNDTVVHEQDLRGLLGRPSGRDAPGYAYATKVACQRVDNRFREVGLPAITLETDEWSYQTGEGEPEATVRASSYEMFRSMWGRRSPEQMKRFNWSVDPDPYVAVMPIFGPSEFAIEES